MSIHDKHKQTVGKLFRANKRLSLFKENGGLGSGGSLEENDCFLVVEYKDGISWYPFCFLVLSGNNLSWLYYHLHDNFWRFASEVEL